MQCFIIIYIYNIVGFEVGGWIQLESASGIEYQIIRVKFKHQRKMMICNALS